MRRGTAGLIVLLLAALAALLLAGCGARSPEPGPGAATASLANETEANPSMNTLAASALAARMAGLGGDSDAVRLLAVNVGKGDALILRVGDAIALIDAGKARATGRVRKALSLMGAEGRPLDGVFLTHTDEDHAGGLRQMAADGGLSARALYASAMFVGVGRSDHPAAAAAKTLTPSGEARWLRRGDAVPLGDSGATLRVLAPASRFEDKDDNNSLVMMLESPQGRLLLTGDMELPEEAELLSQGDDLRCAALKVPNHGDDDTTGAAFANACAAQIAVISTDSAEKPGTPDPGVTRRLEAAGSRVVVTQDAELGVLVTLKDGVATAERVDIDAPLAEGLYIRSVDASDDRITLANRGGSAVDLSGFTLFSERGDELFTFPDGVAIAPGATLDVGSRATDGDCDLLWDESRVVHRKKSDAIRLYDAWGRLLDRAGEG